MIIATEKDRDQVIDILSNAFDDNKSVNFIVGPGGERIKRIRALMAYSFDVCRLFGEAWLSDDRKACLLFLYPDRKKTTLKSIWLDFKLIVNALGLNGLFSALQREKLIAEKQVKHGTIYLWFIGVDQPNQQKGSGTKLLRELIDIADIESRIITLETSTERNLPWYEALGFTIYDRLYLGYQLNFLKKEPE
jgi:ribosomal protein S18 acetylase RimI-like enzyme